MGGEGGGAFGFEKMVLSSSVCIQLVPFDDC